MTEADTPINSDPNWAAERISNNHLQSTDIGVIMLKEAIENPLVLPEVSHDREAFFIEKDPTKTYLLGCGDDRNPTEESLANIVESEDVEQAYLRYFGGIVGVSRVIAVTLAAQYGPEALAAYGQSFPDFINETSERIKKNNKVVPAVHSAETNEENSSKLNLHSENGLGCAYCAGVGAVTGLSKPESELVGLAKMEQPQILGDDSLVDIVSSANTAVSEQFFPEEQTEFSIGREDIVNFGVPVSILAGSHAKAADVEVVENFSIDKISDPTAANKSGKPFYNNDMVPVIEMSMRAYPELKLNPRIMIAVMDHDIRATRAALASSEKLTAADMKLVRHGDPAEAIAYLESLEI